MVKKSLWICLYILSLSLSPISAQRDHQARSTSAEKQDKLSPSLQHLLDESDLKFPQRFSLEYAERGALLRYLDSCSRDYQILQSYLPIHALVLEVHSQACLHALLTCPFVSYIHILPISPIAESGVRHMNLSVNQIQLLHNQAPHLTGEGMTISIKETLYDRDDLDLRGRSLNSGLEAERQTDHATDMATIVAGAGNTSILGKGVASEVLISSSDFQDLFPDSFELNQALGISVQNHSYGTDIENFYGLLAKAYDHASLEDSTLLHVFSAGNLGLETNESGMYQGIPTFASLTGNFKMAKNILTVGFLDDHKILNPRSSHGPAYDGRIKPELVAYSLDGSSNAAALTSGVTALLQQAYLMRHNHLPPSALIKAILLNSAEDIPPLGPDFATGFGNLHAAGALACIEEQRYITGRVNSLDSLSIELNLPSNARNLKITLVWNDLPANSLAPTALVNDLDMKLYHLSTNQTWQPWVLNSFPQPDSLRLPAFRGEDHLNNVEQISISSPETGLYHIDIQTDQLSSDTQSFYIAYQWEEEKQFLWTFPTGSDNMPMDGEQLSAFRWDTNLESESEYGILEYSLDGGNSWESISQEVNLAECFYFWEPPEVWTSAQARMRIDDKVYVTDLFSISRPLPMRLGFNCGDSLLFSWPRLSDIVSYTFYTMGETQLVPIQEMADTFAVVQTSIFPQRHFTVAPRLNDSLHGIKSITVNYENLATQCYISSFSASTVPSEGIELLLEIGTPYELRDIHLEREKEGLFIPIQTRDDFQLRTFFFDSSPEEGLNVYRAVLELSNGRKIVSTPDSAYFLKQQDILLFPNPLSNQEELKVFTRHFDNEILQFYLYDASGRLMFQQELDDEYNYLMLPNLTKGLYIYRVTAPEDNFADKLLIN